MPAVGIPYPVGNPGLPKEDELQVRRRIVKKALEALSTDIEEQTVFE